MVRGWKKDGGLPCAIRRHAMAHATTKISCNTSPLYAFLRASTNTLLSTFGCRSPLEKILHVVQGGTKHFDHRRIVGDSRRRDSISHSVLNVVEVS